MLATDRPVRKTIVKWTAMAYASEEIATYAPIQAEMRAGLDRELAQRLAEFNKRGPRWVLGPVRYWQVPDIEHGFIRYFARATFMAVPDAGD